MVQYTCPRCATALQSPDEAAGSKVACPTCQQRLQIPQPPPTSKTILAPLRQDPVSASVLPYVVGTPASSPENTVTPQVPSASCSERVSISARLIHWPDRCACCFGRATTSLVASACRVTGKRVFNTNEKGWEIPYCHDCAAHVAEAGRIDAELLDAQLRDHYPLEQAGMGTGRKWAIAGVVVFILAVGGTIMRDLPKDSPARAAGALGTCAIATVAGLLLYWLFRAADSAGAARRSAVLEQQISWADDRRRQLVHGACVCAGPAVTYEGWHGSVHTFIFHNGRYAEAFRQANKGKCLA